MAKNTTISILSMGHPQLEAKMGCYTDYEKQIKAYLSSYIDKVLPDNPDIIILPECCDRFSPNNYPDTPTYQKDTMEYARYMENKLTEYLSPIARDNNTNIAYSSVRYVDYDEKYHYRNSTVYIGKDGSICGIYDKNHLVVEENTIYNTAYGTKAELIELDFGKVASAICFDLNFNELMEKYKAQHPDLIVFCSEFHGGLKQEHWAYECQSYFAGAIALTPGRILNPFGETVAKATNYTDFVSATVNLDCRVCHIDYNMAKINAAKAKYKKALTVHEPGQVGSLLLTYNDTDKTIEDVIDEFGIERLDDYLARARKHRTDHIEG